MKLSKPQQAFLNRLAEAGRLDSPHSHGARGSLAALSAWHRTAKSLKDRGLLTLTHNGSMYAATPTPAAFELYQ